MTTTPELVAAAQAVVPALTMQEVRDKLEAEPSVVLLDVRGKEEYDEGHIAEATVLPRGLLEFRIFDVIPDKHTTIILH